MKHVPFVGGTLDGQRLPVKNKINEFKEDLFEPSLTYTRCTYVSDISFDLYDAFINTQLCPQSKEVRERVESLYRVNGFC